MATYHLSAKPISRSAGRSATAAAAYRAGCEIADERTGEVHDYTKKSGVLFTKIVLPEGDTADRAAFWNSVETHHKRGDAVLAREVEVSLPTELKPEQRQALAVGYARELADRYGVAADLALHAPRTVTDKELAANPAMYHETDAIGRRHNGNWHAHIMLSACHVSPKGELGKKAVELDPIHCQRAKIENMADRERGRWADLVNGALERAGHSQRIDHRSLKEQGIEREPTSHKGPAVAGMERRGASSEVGQRIAVEAADRLAKAKEAGELERQAHQVERSIINLGGDLAAAVAERDHQLKIQQAEQQRQAQIKTQQPGINPNSRYHPDNIAKRAAEDAAAAADLAAKKKARPLEEKLAEVTAKLAASGLTPEQRAIVAARVQQITDQERASQPAPAAAPKKTDHLTDADRALVQRMAAAIQSGDKAEIKACYRQLDDVEDKAKRDTWKNQPMPFHADRMAEAIQRDTQSRLQSEMNREAKERGETITPWAEMGARIDSAYDHHASAAAEKLRFHRCSQRPEGFFKKAEGREWDAQLQKHEIAHTGWESAVKRRNVVYADRLAAAEPGNAAQLERERSAHSAKAAQEAPERARALSRHESIRQERETQRAALERALGKGYERELTPSRGMGR